MQRSFPPKGKDHAQKNAANKMAAFLKFCTQYYYGLLGFCAGAAAGVLPAMY